MNKEEIRAILKLENCPLYKIHKDNIYDISEELSEFLLNNLVIKHETEIRKPLEDEIKRFKEDNKDLQEQADTFYEDYCDAVKCIGIAKKEERLKTIAELEEWLHKQSTATYWLNDNESEEHLSVENIKQKLNEMKGE